MRERWVWLYLGGVMLTAAAAAATPDGISYDGTVPALAAVGLWFFARSVWWVAGLARMGEPHPLARVVESAPSGLRHTLRAIPYLLIPLQMSCFLAVKKTIPDYGGFWGDEILAAVDRILFLGRDGWIVTHSLLGPLSTAALDWVYFLWHPVTWSSVFLIAMLGSAEIRARFFLSWVLGWGLLGVLGAIGLASAGPLFAADLGGPEFPGLMDTLRATDRQYELMTLKAREMLLSAYQSGEGPLVAAISAAPSLHVAITTLLVLVAGRLFFWPAVCFAILTFIATIHLGWHYAIDGILGAAGMLVVWKLVGLLLALLEQPRRTHFFLRRLNPTAAGDTGGAAVERTR